MRDGCYRTRCGELHGFVYFRRVAVERASENVGESEHVVYLIGKIAKPFDKRLLPKVSRAVAQAADESGVARRPLADLDAYERWLNTLIDRENRYLSELMAHEGAERPKLVCDVMGVPKAYDAACPVEVKRDVRVFINDEHEAECPVCHSTPRRRYGPSPAELAYKNAELIDSLLHRAADHRFEHGRNVNIERSLHLGRGVRHAFHVYSYTACR